MEEPICKVCGTCDVSKELSEFSKDKNRKDGLQSRCKGCVKIHSQHNIVAMLAAKKGYREKNKEILATKQNTYRAENGDVIVAYRENHKETQQASSYIYRTTRE